MYVNTENGELTFVQHHPIYSFNDQSFIQQMFIEHLYMPGSMPGSRNKTMNAIKLVGTS